MISRLSSSSLRYGVLLGLASVLPLAAQQKVTTTSASLAYNTPQFLWFNTQNALRVGTVSGTAWDTIGAYSFAFGPDAEASGAESFAFGSSATATGILDYPSGAFAFGPSSTAGYASIAIGYCSTAMMQGTALGPYAYAENGGTNVGGSGYATNGGVSLGESFAYGAYSLAAIYAATSGDYSVAVGVESSAIGDYSVVIGGRSFAAAWGQVVLGSGNKGVRKDGTAIDPETPSPGDPIFEFARSDPARGDSWSYEPTPSENPLTIYRDGQAHFSSVVRVKPGGDIPMTGFQAIPSGVSYP